MTKYIYKVVKPFSIYKDDNGNKRIAKNEDEEKSGASFKKNAMYVDYEFEDRKINVHPLTSSLETKNYIELEKEKKMKSR